MISGAGDSQKALLTAMAAKGDSPSVIIVPSQKDVFRWEMDLRFFAPDLHLYYFPWWKKQDSTLLFQEQNGFVTA